MILNELSVVNFRGFRNANILFERGVTVITGPNDAGKSAILNFLQLIHESKGVLSANDANEEALADAGVSWREADVVTYEATYTASRTTKKHLPNFRLSDGQTFVVKGNLRASGIASRFFGPNRDGALIPQVEWPTVVNLTDSPLLGEEFAINSTDKNHQNFLRLAFGENFSPNALEDTPFRVGRRLRSAGEELDHKFGKILPVESRYKFHLDLLKDSKPYRLAISIQDSHGSEVGISMRGAGARRLLSLLGHLALYNFKEGQFLILFDEPETSLHSDSQHMLRSALEALSSLDNLQVVYATHSPSMINTSRPEGVRLVTRGTLEGRPSSIVDNKPYVDNFSAVRQGLGINAADSLLYAPVCLIVEGPTEALCIPELFRRLACTEGFEKALPLLGSTCIIQGGGDSYFYMAKLAEAQGSLPVIFLDGDKKVRAGLSDVDKREIPIIRLAEGKDFEGLLPVPAYFRGISLWRSECGTTPVEVREGDFYAWRDSDEKRSKMMFSRQVARWYEDAFEFSLDKPRVMRLAVQNVEPQDISTEELAALVKAMVNAVGLA